MAWWLCNADRVLCRRQTLLEYARIPPAVNQIEVHPYMRNDYNIKFCRSKVRWSLPSLLSGSHL